MAEAKITVLIADDHPIFRRGLRQIIEKDAALHIVAEVGDGDAALAQMRALQPQVAVLDVDMPQRDGFAVMRSVLAEKLSCAVVFLTMYKEERFFNAALDAGVIGYVVKDSAIHEITTAIRAAARGKNFISPLLTTFLLNRLRRAENQAPADPLDTLTTAERRVLQLVAGTKSNQQIADELFISIRTVEHHRSNICAKLGLEGKNALLAFALTHQAEL